MNVGDKVRMMRGREEGIVTRIIDQKLIEIEIEDGFQIPVLRSEVVVVAKEEASYFRREEQPVAAAPQTPAKKAAASQHDGYYVAFKPLNDRLLSVHLVNNTSGTLLYSVFEEKNGSFKGIDSGQLKARQAHKFAQADMHQFEQWPTWHVRLLPHPEDSIPELPAPLHQRIQPKASSFFKHLRDTPVLNTKAYLIAFNNAKLATEAVEQLQDRLQNKKEALPAAPLQRIPAEVDLHLEKLVDNPKDIPATEILPLQLATFEQVLDRAIASGMQEITFVHGVGNGTLRKEIHRRLSNLNSVAWFKDAQKEKWGYGATLVHLK